MMTLKEAKRRLTWLWRLACSRVIYVCSGKTPAIWLYDTVDQPDGAVLRSYAHSIARNTGLELSEFGPSRLAFGNIIGTMDQFFSLVRYVAASDFDRQFSGLVIRILAQKTDFKKMEVVLVGSTKGTFAQAAIACADQAKIWEIQHGLLDPSYFPMLANRFFARSSSSAELVRRLAPGVLVESFFDCLEPPIGAVVPLEHEDVLQLNCFSKNPGGGCTAQELAQFEADCAQYAQKQGWKFSLHLHPRDNIAKLLVRHKRLLPLCWAANAYLPAVPTQRLIVSAYSSALISNSRTGDRLLNIRISAPDATILHEYRWLPTTSGAALHDDNVKLDVFFRNE